MFTFAAVENFGLVSVPGAGRWISALFGVPFVIAAVICFISPEGTFAALADSPGSLFLVVGIWWMVRAFLEREINSLWWLGLISGILMAILAFWTAGQFFIERAYVRSCLRGSGRPWCRSLTSCAPSSCSARIESRRSRAMVLPS